ncbi:MAG: class I SAM-dependent methyltransferase [Rhodoferax sp.]|nr:class I SAM-dependent methyltransferase [Rhodoferax sp.]
MHDWLQTPAGRYLLEWERARMDAAVADIFGYHALQLGVPELDGLQANRMPHKWLALEGTIPNAPSARPPALLCDFSALPFAPNSLDLVLMPHTLESSTDPHATLREVERVLVPEGRVVICGFNSASLWGFRQKRGRLYRKIGVDAQFLPANSASIGYWRLRDWLGLLGFEIEVAEFGCYRPGVESEYWLQRLAWMDATGARWWPIFGAVYFLVAVKRVRGMRLLEPSWKKTPVTVHNPASVTNRLSDHAADLET